MAEIPNVRLSLPSSPENVLVVRQALTGVAGALALDAIETNDLNTAVTEACNNVVMHAYGGGEGALEVDVCVLAGALAVVVRDRGSGMPTRDEDEDEDEDEDRHTGMGIPVIEALSRRVRFTAPADGGTEVRMEFDTAKAPPLACLPAPLRASSATEGPRTGESIDDDELRSVALTHGEPPSTIELRLAPNAIARAVLPRVLSALAARAYFSTDRISDVQLVADALAASAGDSIGASHLDVGVTVSPRKLELRVGPLLAAETLELSLVDEREDSR